MVYDSPIFMDERKERIHELGYIAEMWWHVIPDSDRSLAVAATQLADIRNRCIVQRPQGILIECLDALLQTNFDAI